jgi:pyruvate/2-oxoglutarate dehydrogenase complex dihydrolipoamide acyltransferase (E2) component
MEPEPLFKIVALGVQPLHDPSTVRAHLRHILSGNPASVEAAIQRILVQETTLLASGLTAAQVAEYQQRCAALGLLYTVSPMVLHLQDQDEEAEKALPKWQNWTAAQPAPPESQPARPVPAAEPEPLGPTLSERLHTLRAEIRDQSPQQRLTLTLIPVGLAAILAGLAGLLFWKQPDISISPYPTPRTEASAPNASTAPSATDRAAKNTRGAPDFPTRPALLFRPLAAL